RAGPQTTEVFGRSKVERNQQSHSRIPTSPDQVPPGTYSVRSFAFWKTRDSHVITRKFPIEHLDPVTLLGRNDVNLRQIERTLPVRITPREGWMTLAGDAASVDSASRALRELVELAEKGKVIEEADVATALGPPRKNGDSHSLAEAYEGAPGYVFERKAVKARTPMQAEYLKA